MMTTRRPTADLFPKPRGPRATLAEFTLATRPFSPWDIPFDPSTPHTVTVLRKTQSAAPQWLTTERSAYWADEEEVRREFKVDLKDCES